MIRDVAEDIVSSVMGADTGSGTMTMLAVAVEGTTYAMQHLQTQSCFSIEV